MPPWPAVRCRRYFLWAWCSPPRWFIGCLEVVTGKLVGLFFGSEFAEATPIARILLLATLFMAARRVLTDGVDGLGRPGLGTLAEIASWVLLVPTIAILLPSLRGRGRRARTCHPISWFASLLLLLVLMHTSIRCVPSVRPVIPRVMRRGPLEDHACDSLFQQLASRPPSPQAWESPFSLPRHRSA